MAKIFGWVSLIALLTGLCFGRSAMMSEAILVLPLNVFSLTLSLVVNACLWNGLLAIAEKAGLIAWLSRLIAPLFKRIYPMLENQDQLLGLLGSNFMANFFGLGSLAMLSGLKAIQALDDLNEHREVPSRSMRTLIIFNTTGCSLFPMSIIAMRQNFAAIDPMGFIGFTLLIGILSLTLGILLQKGVERFGK